MEQAASKAYEAAPARNGGGRFSRWSYTIRSSVTVALLTAVLAAFAPAAHAIDAGAFGYKRHDATGMLPLLVIWIRQHDDTPKAELERRKQYYEETIFGRPDRFAGYPEALRQLEPSVGAFYQDASGRQVRLASRRIRRPA